MKKNIGARVRAFASLAAIAALMAGIPFSGGGSLAQESGDDVLYGKAQQALKGKTVAFIPIAMSFDVPQSYDLAIKRHAAKWGYNYIVRDPNFSVEQAVQAIDQLISEKPDILVVMPYDASAFNRLVKKANDAGILWVTVTQKSPTAAIGDAYVGPNFFEFGRVLGKAAAERCGSGTSGKVAIIQTPPNNASTIGQTLGAQAEVAKHPNMSVVSVQSAVGDANKAHAIASTVIKQHPDLCAFIDLWDGEGVGIPSAIEETGMKGKIAVITTGAGYKDNSCAHLVDGTFEAYVSYDSANQGREITSVISQLLQAKPTPGKTTYAIYDEPQILTKASLTDASCWTKDQLQKPLN
jgi:ribose transport system substrate-binding protein